jgi:hypothetical protein
MLVFFHICFWCILNIKYVKHYKYLRSHSRFLWLPSLPFLNESEQCSIVFHNQVCNVSFYSCYVYPSVLLCILLISLQKPCSNPHSTSNVWQSLLLYLLSKFCILKFLLINGYENGISLLLVICIFVVIMAPKCFSSQGYPIPLCTLPLGDLSASFDL